MVLSLSPLRAGDRSPEVGNWQRFLNELGVADDAGRPLVEDEVFGARSAQATRRWQDAHGLAATGIVDGTARRIATSQGFIPYLQARNFGPSLPSRTIDLLVIHDMEYPERPEGAEWCAQFFAGANAPKASAHYCLDPEVRILRGDLRWCPIGSVREGDELAACEEITPGLSGRTLQKARITRLSRRRAECVRIITADEREIVCSTDHRWLGRQPEDSSSWHWLDARWLKTGSTLCAPFTPWSSREDRLAGYIEGLLDGEGCWSSSREVTFSQKRGPVLDHALTILREASIPLRTHYRAESGVVIVTLSGLNATLRALGEFGSRRLAKEDRWVGRALRSRVYDNALTVAAVEQVGESEVVSIETTTRTFFAEGIVSHNCVDSNSVVQCVRDRDVAWHAPGGNRNGIGIEHAGYAKQSREEWLDDYSRAELEISARLAAKLVSLYDIPIQRLTDTDLKAGGARGFTGHVDLTLASGKPGHHDPGPHFPWDFYLDLVRQAAGRS